MLLKKMNGEQVTYDKDNFGYTKEFYGSEYVSNNTWKNTGEKKVL